VNRVFTLVTLAALALVPLGAQSAADMDAALDSGEVTWEQAALFTLQAAGRGGASGEEALAAFGAMNGLPRKAKAGEKARLEGVSLMVMKAFGLTGGLYDFFPISRYAYRELIFLKIIQGRADPWAPVSGERLFHILARALEYTEDGALFAVPEGKR
jgi:hypothetical protein